MEVFGTVTTALELIQRVEPNFKMAKNIGKPVISLRTTLSKIMELEDSVDPYRDEDLLGEIKDITGDAIEIIQARRNQMPASMEAFYWFLSDDINLQRIETSVSIIYAKLSRRIGHLGSTKLKDSLFQQPKARQLDDIPSIEEFHIPPLWPSPSKAQLAQQKPATATSVPCWLFLQDVKDALIRSPIQLDRLCVVEGSFEFTLLEYEDADHTVMVTHKIPPGTIPVTPDHVEATEVSFEKRHYITVESEQEYVAFFVHPTYRFHSSLDCMLFMTTARGRNIVNVFRPRKIVRITGTGSTYKKFLPRIFATDTLLARNRLVRIWQSIDEVYGYPYTTITFHNRTRNEVAEYALEVFANEPILTENNEGVQLSLLGRDEHILFLFENQADAAIFVGALKKVLAIPGCGSKTSSSAHTLPPRLVAGSSQQHIDQDTPPNFKNPFPELHVKDSKGKTNLLHVAARNQHQEDVINLLRQGHNPNEIDDEKCTALHYAAQTGAEEIVKTLLEYKADANLKDQKLKTALHYAVGVNSMSVVKTLLLAGADPSSKGTDNEPILHFALKNSSMSIVEALLAAGADPSAKDHNSNTALHIATHNRHLDLLRLLLSYGADMNAKDDSGRLILNIAIRRVEISLIIEFLLSGAKTIECEDIQHLPSCIPDILSWRFGPGEEPQERLAVRLHCELQEALYEIHSTQSTQDPVTAKVIFDTLSNLFVITGSDEVVECGMTLSFLRKTWKGLGEVALLYLSQALFHLHDSRENRKTPDSSHAVSLDDVLTESFLKVNLWKKASWHTPSLNTTDIILEIIGVPSVSCSIIEAMIWACTAIRPNGRVKPTQSQLKSSMTCNSHRTIKKLHLKFTEFILSPLAPILPPEASSISSCWTEMFHSCIIAQRAIKRDWGQGLEMSFEMMIKFGAVENYYRYDSGTILLGFFTALVPTAYDKFHNSVQWHFETSDTSKQQIIPEKLNSVQHTWFKTTDLKLIQRARCFVGWSNVGKILLGTRQLLENNRMEYSVDTEEHHQTLYKGGIEAGGQLGFSFSPINVTAQVVQTLQLRSNVQRFEPSKMYLESIHLSYDKIALVVDSKSKQSWLVPLLSLLLHLCHRWVQDMIPDLEKNPLPYVEPSTNGAKAVLEAIGKEGDIVVFGTGGSDQETLRQLWLRISSNVLNTAKTSERPDRRWIYASEIMALVKEPAKGSPLKMIAKSRGIKSWQHIIDKVDVVGVCSNIGYAIEPTPAEVAPAISKTVMCGCYILPQGRDFLVAPLQCLKVLAQRAGCSSEDLRKGNYAFGGNLIWRIAMIPQVSCCDHHVPIWDDRLQEENVLQQLLYKGQTVKAMDQTQSAMESMLETGVVVFGAPAVGSDVDLRFKKTLETIRTLMSINIKRTM